MVRGLLHGSAAMVRGAELFVTGAGHVLRRPDPARRAPERIAGACLVAQRERGIHRGHRAVAPRRVARHTALPARPGRGSMRVAGMFRRVPRITAGTTGQAARAAMANAPVWNFPSPTVGLERAFGEEHQRVTAGRGAQHAPRIGAALVAIEAVDELGADPAQAAGRPRGTVVHLALDHETEAGAAGAAVMHHAVEVAGVIGHDHALPGAAGFQAAQASAACPPGGRTLLCCNACGASPGIAKWAAAERPAGPPERPPGRAAPHTGRRRSAAEPKGRRARGRFPDRGV